MAWKPSGQPHVRSRRDKWVVRIDGIDSETGKGRPRQLRTHTPKRAATKAASEFAAQRDTGGGRRIVGAFVTKWAAGRVDVAENTREQYVWAAGHIAAGIGAIRVDRRRGKTSHWLDDLASAGITSRRSIQIVRMVLRAALDEAVDPGDLNRSPAARVDMPRQVTKKDRVREVDAWDEPDLRKFLGVAKALRWGGRSRSLPSTVFAEVS